VTHWVARPTWPDANYSVPERMPSGDPWPVITIVTPSYNQAGYLEEAIVSILNQGYPNLDFRVLDGGSTDGSVKILERYAPWLSFWTSEPDEGQYAAIERGLSEGVGTIMGWLNCDDLHCPWTLRVVAEAMSINDDVRWLTSSISTRINEVGTPYNTHRVRPRTAQGILAGDYAGPDSREGIWVQQESTFWKRSLWEEAGDRLDRTYSLAADFELWLRFAHMSEISNVNVPLSLVREHSSRRSVGERDRYLQEARDALGRFGVADERRTVRRIPVVRRRFAQDAVILTHDPSTCTWRIRRQRR
jgi:glycosyltransferase involved in cell wall biosynthesis